MAKFRVGGGYGHYATDFSTFWEQAHTRVVDRDYAFHGIYGSQEGPAAVLDLSDDGKEHRMVIYGDDLVLGADGFLHGTVTGIATGTVGQRSRIFTVRSELAGLAIDATLFDRTMRADMGTIEPALPALVLAGYDRITMNALDNSFDGFDGNDVIRGGLGNDRLMGGAGNDRLLGQFDHDQLFGGDGQDTLVAGDGYERLYGGAGRDLFVFDPDFNDQYSDIIFEFIPGEDRIRLKGMAMLDFDDLTISYASVGLRITAYAAGLGGIEIELSGPDAPQDLTARDFLFG